MEIILFLLGMAAICYWIVRDFYKHDEYSTDIDRKNLKPGQWRDDEDQIHTESTFD